MQAIKNGTVVLLDDGSLARVYRKSDGTYTSVQRNLTTGGWREDDGWRREQLSVVARWPVTSPWLV